MIEAGMREYTLLMIPEDRDKYGERAEPVDAGTVRISISLYAQSRADNVNYKDCQYVGVTYNRAITDAHIIQYGEKRLKVKLVNPCGRMVQLILEEWRP